MNMEPDDRDPFQQLTENNRQEENRNEPIN